MSRKKKLSIIFLIIIILFGLYNLFWFVSTRYTYRDYVKAVPKESGAHIQFDEKKQLTYNVKTPDYLYFTGNLGVSNKEGMVLLIWPSLFGKDFEYGLRIENKSEVHEIYIDENLKPVSHEPMQEKIIEDNYEEVKRLYDSAQEKFF